MRAIALIDEDVIRALSKPKHHSGVEEHVGMSHYLNCTCKMKTAVNRWLLIGAFSCKQMSVLAQWIQNYSFA